MIIKTFYYFWSFKSSYKKEKFCFKEIKYTILCLFTPKIKCYTLVDDEIKRNISLFLCIPFPKYQKVFFKKKAQGLLKPIELSFIIIINRKLY